MENVNSVLINDIVKNFQHPTAGIEAEQKMFILMIGKINLVFKNPVGKSAANIRLANPVLKSRFAELNITIQHILTLPQIRPEYNSVCPLTLFTFHSSFVSVVKLNTKCYSKTTHVV